MKTTNFLQEVKESKISHASVNLFVRGKVVIENKYKRQNKMLINSATPENFRCVSVWKNEYLCL